jgi:hypothetical protein
MYPNFLQHFSVPFTKGTFSIITELKTKYGIYRCVINPSNNIHINKLFRFNQKNFYTHSDIKTANLLGLEIVLIQDGKYNAIEWKDNERYKGSDIFTQYINDFYFLKEKYKDNPLPKRVLNSLWGLLSQKEKKNYYADGKEKLDIPDEDEIDDITPLPNNRTKITTTNKNKIFTSDWGRLGCFLTAFCRNKIAEFAYENREYIVRIHTDSLVSTKPMNHLKISNKIGDWKMKQINKAFIGKCNQKIKNSKE